MSASSRMLVRSLFGGALLALLSSCAEKVPPARVVSLTSADVSSATPPASGRHIPAGTRLSLHLNSAIGTDISKHGDWFTATVTRSVYTSKGDELLIPVGAQVTGRVIMATGGRAATLAVEFETIETMRGVMPISGTLASATTTVDDATPNHRSTASPWQPDDPSVVAYSSTVSPFEPSGNDSPPRAGRQLRLPAGAAMELALTKPIVIAGTDATQ